MKDLKILIDQEYNILEITEGILSYMNLPAIIPFAYPGDSIQPNDIILYLNTETGITPEILSRLNIAISPDSNNRSIALLTQLDSSRVQEIVKFNADLDEAEDEGLINTVFNGYQVILKVNLQRKVTSLRVDDFLLLCAKQIFSENRQILSLSVAFFYFSPSSLFVIPNHMF